MPDVIFKRVPNCGPVLRSSIVPHQVKDVLPRAALVIVHDSFTAMPKEITPALCLPIIIPNMIKANIISWE
jgi:hypothetical protein